MNITQLLRSHKNKESAKAELLPMNQKLVGVISDGPLPDPNKLIDQGPTPTRWKLNRYL